MKRAEGILNCFRLLKIQISLYQLTLLTQYKNNKTLSVKRKNVLSHSLSDYETYADVFTEGYINAARFLVQQSILASRDIPYTTQLVPLAVLMAVLGRRAEDGAVKAKLTSWYWCGVFGEMYGSANEVRYAKDVSSVLLWIDGGDEPDAISRAFFSRPECSHSRRATALLIGTLWLLYLPKAQEISSAATNGLHIFRF